MSRGLCPSAAKFCACHVDTMEQALSKIHIRDDCHIDPRQLHELGLTQAVVYRRGEPVGVRWETLVCLMLRALPAASPPIETDYQTHIDTLQACVNEVTALGQAFTARLQQLEDRVTIHHADMLLRTGDTATREVRSGQSKLGTNVTPPITTAFEGATSAGAAPSPKPTPAPVPPKSGGVVGLRSRLFGQTRLRSEPSATQPAAASKR